MKDSSNVWSDSRYWRLWVNYTTKERSAGNSNETDWREREERDSDWLKGIDERGKSEEQLKGMLE